MNASPGNNLPS